MAKKKQEEQAPGSPAWMATFSDLMNLLLCFFVLLFSMSTVDAKKFEEVAASFSQTFSVFTSGALSIGDGMLISNGVSQLNELDEYINSTGKTAEDIEEAVDDILAQVEAQKTQKSEELEAKVAEAISEAGMDDIMELESTSQYVQITLNGALLFESGSAELSEDAKPVLDQVGIILERYSEGTIEIEGHTDSVPINSKEFPSNNELSDARALAVFYYLMDVTNLDPAYVKHSGRGEYVPIADNSTAEGRALNRRVEIKIYNSLSDY